MFKLPENIKKDISKYRKKLIDFINGNLSSSRFKGIRVPWGIYSHRGHKVYMNRIRIPSGLLNPEQIKVLAKVASKYGSGVLHITTRQDIQIHDVKIENSIKVIEELKNYDLSPRGGGGNTLRNVMGCPLSGICKDEVFDIRKYAIGVSEHLLRQDSSYNLPRKYKVAFSACSKDCAGTMVNDIGFLAKKKDKIKGFKVYLGGGLGAESKVGKILEEFIPEHDVGYVTLAVKNIFYKKGNRQNKHHNRIRFLVEDLGFDNFRKLYKQEFKKLKKSEYIKYRKIDFKDKKLENQKKPENDAQKYNEFVKYNVISQKQKGYSCIQLRIAKGNISSEKLKVLSNQKNNYPDIGFRTSQNQNLYISWVPNSELYEVYKKIDSILDEFLYPETLLDVVTCKGASTCNLGLCNSPALSSTLENVIKENFIGTQIFNRMNIRINGCPNACGQQPIGMVSMHGVIKRVDERLVPFYKFFLGGRKQADKTKLAQEIGLVPAKNIPNFLKDFFKKADKQIKGKTDIYKYILNGGRQLAKESLDKFSYVPSYSENKSYYKDWGKQKDFSLAGLGKGECGAGVIDMIESDLQEAKMVLNELKEKNYDTDLFKKVLFLSTRALLIVKGEDPQTENEVFKAFENRFLDEKIANNEFSDIKTIYYNITDNLNKNETKEIYEYTKRFYRHINELYQSMDPQFNFPGEKTQKSELEEKTDMENIKQVLNLKGTPCPINYVKTKLALENKSSGDIIEILLDEGEPIQMVPKSLKNDGHSVLKIKKEDGFYSVKVRKK